MKPFSFSVLTAFVGAAIIAFVFWGGDKQWFTVPSMTIEMIIINVLVTALIYTWLFKVTTPDRFVNSYLLSIVLKLLFYTALLLGIRLIAPTTLVANAVLVMVCYFIFTVLEVSVLFLKVNRD